MQFLWATWNREKNCVGEYNLNKYMYTNVCVLLYLFFFSSVSIYLYYSYFTNKIKFTHDIHNFRFSFFFYLKLNLWMFHFCSLRAIDLQLSKYNFFALFCNNRRCDFAIYLFIFFYPTNNATKLKWNVCIIKWLTRKKSIANNTKH